MVLEIIGGCILLLLAYILAVNFKDRLHPAPTMLATWGMIVLSIAMAHPLGYYQIETLPLLLYFCGVGAFVVGATIANHAVYCSGRIKYKDKTNAINIERLTLFCLFAHMVMLPLWWEEIIAMVGGQTDLISLSFTLRYLTASEGEKLSSLVGNYLVIGFVIVPILIKSAMELNIRWSTALFVSAPWFVTNIITNGRGALVQLMLAILYLYILQNRVMKFKSFLIIGALIASVMTIGALLVGKNNATIEGSIGQLLFSSAENILDYTLQGPILFSSYFDNNNLIKPTWDAMAFPCGLLQYFDVCTVGPLHQDYLPFNSDGRVGNVYSIFLSIYPKYGLAGLMLFLMLYGAWAGFHHHRARTTNSLTHSLMAAYLYSAIILSIFSDLFAPSLNFFIKMIMLSMVIQLIFNKKLAAQSKRERMKSITKMPIGSMGN